MNISRIASFGASVLILLIFLSSPIVATTDVSPHFDSSIHEEDNSTTIGTHGEYSHDSIIPIADETQLTQSEIEALISRGMARVEYIRERPFKSPVEVKLSSRQEAQQAVQTTTSTDEDLWNDQVWEALFIIGNDESANDVISGDLSASMLGYYVSGTDEIVLIVDDEGITIPEKTLIHELAHAMQDQYHDLTAEKYYAPTQDMYMGVNGLIEGEAVYIETKYEEYCQSGYWECYEPNIASSSDSVNVNLGVFLIAYQPYSDGPEYVHNIRTEAGWEGVNALWESPPTTSREIIHQNTRETVWPTLSDGSFATWETFPETIGLNGADSLGEGSVFTMMWYQDRFYGTSFFEGSTVISTPASRYSAYDYTHPVSSELSGDIILPYKNSYGDTGFVWKTVWTSSDAANRFLTAYQTIIKQHGGFGGPGELTIPDGKFEGVFTYTQINETVYIAKAPTAEDSGTLLENTLSNEDESALQTSVDPNTYSPPTTEQSKDSLILLSGLVALILAVSFVVYRRID